MPKRTPIAVATTPTTRTLSLSVSVDPDVVAQITDLALPMLEKRGPKDPTAIAKIFRLALDHEIPDSDLVHLTGMSGKMLRHFAQARTSSGRHFSGLRAALGRLKVPVRPRNSHEIHEVAAPTGERKRTKKTAPVQKPAQHTPAAPTPQTKAPTLPPSVEVREDGAITLVIRPGDPGYAETLRGLLTRAA